MNQHKTPIIASAIGLLLVLVLGLAPLFEGSEKEVPIAAVDTPPERQSAQANAVSADFEARLAVLEGSMAKRISDLELKVDILNKAVGRMNVKLAGQAKQANANNEIIRSNEAGVDRLNTQVGTLNKAAGRMNVKLARQGQKATQNDEIIRSAAVGVDRLNTQVSTLNKAAGRMNVKLAKQGQQATANDEILRSAAAGVDRLNTQVSTLNRAVTRIHKRYRTHIKDTSEQSEQLERLVNFEENLSALIAGTAPN